MSNTENPVPWVTVMRSPYQMRSEYRGLMRYYEEQYEQEVKRAVQHYLFRRWKSAFQWIHKFE